jgi:hypothetical protein
VCPRHGESLSIPRAVGVGNDRERKISFKEREGVKYLSAAPDFIRTQLHAKSVICSNRGAVLIGSSSFSVWDRWSFAPQPKIIRGKGGESVRDTFHTQNVALGVGSCTIY